MANVNVMKIEDGIKKASQVMELAARAQKDKGVLVWTADEHVTACGYVIRVLFHPKDETAPRLEPTTQNYRAVFHALYNQSAWRQTFERLKIFDKKTVKTYEDKVAELEEEMGE